VAPLGQANGGGVNEVARDFEDIDRDFGGEAVKAALDAAQHPWADGPPPIGDEQTDGPTFAATPFQWRDPATLPRRKFLYGFELRRRQLSAVVAPGAAGKTTYKIARAISMVTGRDLLGHRVWNGPHRVWLWNLEDEMEECEKLVHAFMKLWNLSELDLGGRLFMSGADSIGSAGLKLAAEDNFGSFKLQRPVASALIDALHAEKIDYLDVDPFVSSHAVDENSNQAIDAVAKEWLRIAQEADCAISLAHHLRKATGQDFTAMDARGAGAMINAARSVLVLQRMSSDEAKKLQVLERDRKSYFKLYDDKNNKAPAAASAEWYEFKSIGLGNQDETGPEDSIGAVQRWTPPDVFGGVTVHQLLNIQKLINEQPQNARKHSASNKWVGRIVAYVLDRNIDKAGDLEAIKEMISTWLDGGALVTVARQNEKREVVDYVEVGEWAVIE
jgi:hypothetical protein